MPADDPADHLQLPTVYHDPNIGDANTMIPETKAFLVYVEKVEVVSDQ